MKRGTAHAGLRSQVVDTQWLCEVALQPIDCPRYLITLAPRRSDLAQALTLIPHKQAVDDFPLDYRRQDRNVGSSRRNRAKPGTAVVCCSPFSVELTAGDLREIEQAAAQITVLGARYPEKLEQLTGR